MQSESLKQPKQFTHKILEKNSEKNRESEKEGGDKEKGANKTKKIVKKQKIADKKVIKKKFQPSAIRLKAINQTFHKIQENTEKMLDDFNFDKNLLHEFLSYKSKVKCQCGRNIRFYCLKCMTKNKQLPFPKLQLPFSINIIHHTSQKINKSSIIPMMFLANQIKLSLYQGKQLKTQKIAQNTKKEQIVNQTQQLSNLLGQSKLETTYILFPHKNSRKLDKQVVQNIQQLIILDCTWFQTDIVVNQLQSKGFSNFIRLDNYQSLFWRYNHHSDKALSSAESLAYFLRQFQTLKNSNKKQFDALMFLYCLNLKIVNDSYTSQAKISSDQKDKNQIIV